MEWLHPEYRWAFGSLLLVAGGWLWFLYARRRVQRALGDQRIIVRLVEGEMPLRSVLRWFLLLLAVALMVTALMGPRYGIAPREVKREGVDLILALDVSNSMLAEDVPPTRLQRARHEIGRLLDQLESDRVGLILFAGDAFIQCPLTTDMEAVRMFLDVADPELMPAQGTNFGAAIRVAMQAFEGADAEKEGERPSRVLLIVSDGENHEGDVKELAEEARRAGIVILTAGVGELAGAPVPVYRNGRRVGYKRDAQGKVVRTRLVEDDLQALAIPEGYVHIGRRAGTLTALVDRLEALDRNTYETVVYEDYEERYQWPLAAGLLLLLFDVGLGLLHRETRHKVAG